MRPHDSIIRSKVTRLSPILLLAALVGCAEPDSRTVITLWHQMRPVEAELVDEQIARFEEQRAELERVQADAYTRADARAEKLRDMEITITANAGSEGKLFGSVGTADIADAANASGAEVEKREIRLPEGPLREIGDYDIEVHLNADITVTIKVKVIPDEGGSAA